MITSQNNNSFQNLSDFSDTSIQKKLYKSNQIIDQLYSHSVIYVQAAVNRAQALGKKQMYHENEQKPHTNTHTSRAPYNAGILINSLQELPYDEWNTLDALHLLLRVKVFLLQVALLILDVFLLNSKKLELPLQFL